MRKIPFLLLLGVCLLCAHLKVFASLGDGLIGYWPLNGDALDYSGNDYHGTVLNGASFVPNPTGSSQVLQTTVSPRYEGHVQVGLPPSRHSAANVIGFKSSGSIWIMFDDEESMIHAPGWQGILGHPPGLNYVARQTPLDRIRTMARRIEQAPGNVNYWMDSGVSSASLEGVWYHIAWTFHSHTDGGDGHFRWYINGALKTEITTGIQTSPTSNFLIGASQEAYSNNSKIAEVRLYDRILSAEEVGELYHQAGFHPRGHYPRWWTEYGVIDEDAPIDDYAAVNQGQLKHVATQAAAYMNDALDLVGGAGSAINSMVSAWTSPAPQADDYAAVNLGQLKFVSAKFYNRLAEVAFDQWPSGMVIDAATGYPWASASNSNDDYALANQGQLKFLFGWSLKNFNIDSGDIDENGLPDWWEREHFGQIGTDAGADSDGDGVSNLLEYLSGGNPLLGDSNADGTLDMSRYLAGLNLSLSHQSGQRVVTVLSVLE